LAKLKQQADANEHLKTVIQHVIALKAKELTDALLGSASFDIALLIGEEVEKSGFFDSDTTFKRMCDISLVAPICRLVRRSARTVPVIAQDFDDFAEAVRSNDAAKLQQHSQKSGVQMDELKTNCGKMLGKKLNALKPIELIWSYVSADLLDVQQVEARMEQDTELASYNSLYNLCNLVK
jgi:hypothetical protein